MVKAFHNLTVLKTMKKIFQILLAIFSLSIFSQEKYLEIENDLKIGSKNVKSAFSVVNENTGNFAIFLDDDNALYGYLYSPGLDLVRRFASEGLPKQFSQIIGYSIQGKKIRLFLKDSKSKIFGSVLFDFEIGSTEETVYDFKLKHELYVEGYTDESKFYLITLLKGTNELNFYVFDEGKPFQKESINIKGTPFFNNLGAIINLNELMGTGGKDLNRSSYGFNVDKIDSESPNSIETTSSIVKMYPGKSGFKLTVDAQRRTYILDFSTSNLSYTVSTIDKLTTSGTEINSNSFILDDKIYIISASTEEMIFSIKNLASGEELKNFRVTKNEEIPFKNTPIIQEGGKLKNYRILDKTSQFLRRMSNEDIGVATTKSNNNFVVTLGSKKEISSGGAPMMMPGFGIPVGSIGSFAVTFNPTFFAYGNYTSTKATRIESLFDEDFNHLKGEIPENVFDKISEAGLKLPSTDAETVFKLGNSYIWGFYDQKLEKYILYRF